MACCKWHRGWLRALKYIVVFVVAAGTLLSIPEASASVRARPKRHFLSYESLNRPEEYRHLKKPASLRRLEVSKRRVVKLKKSSFWNRRPYQFSTPIVDGERLYVGVDAGFFYAVDKRLGKKVWTFETEGAVHGPAVVAGPVVYVGDSKANVYALETAGGTELWRTKLDTEVLARPLIFDDRIYILTMSGRLYALDSRGGSEIWHTDPFEQDYGFSVRRSSNPVIRDGVIYLGTSTGAILAYRASDGSVVWMRQLGERQSRISDVDSSPTFVGGHLWAASADRGLFAINHSNGDIVWALEGGGPNDILYHGGRLYTTGGGVVNAIDPEGGNILWQQDLETPEISSPAGGKNYLAVVSTSDKLYLIDSGTGDVLYERYVRKGGFGDPVTVNDEVYVLSNTGRLFSFRVRELPPRRRRH